MVGGSEWEKMGHKHVGWHGNIAMGLQEIARRGRFEGVNTRISGKSSGLRAVQLAWGVDFVKRSQGAVVGSWAMWYKRRERTNVGSLELGGRTLTAVSFWSV